MRYVNLGSSGLKVSRICLGCMAYGDGTKGNHPWALGERESQPFFRQALDAGINFFDTANVYSDGVSEEITGRALKQIARREEIVVATKVHGVMRPERPQRRAACRARRSSRRSTPACRGSAWTMSTSIRSIAGMPRRRSRRRWRRSTTS